MTMHHNNVNYYKDMVYDYSQRENNSANDYGNNNDNTDDGLPELDKPRRHSSEEPNEIQQVFDHPPGNIRMIF